MKVVTLLAISILLSLCFAEELTDNYLTKLDYNTYKLAVQPKDWRHLIRVNAIYLCETDNCRTSKSVLYDRNGGSSVFPDVAVVEVTSSSFIIEGPFWAQNQVIKVEYQIKNNRGALLVEKEIFIQHHMFEDEAKEEEVVETLEAVAREAVDELKPRTPVSLIMTTIVGVVFGGAIALWMLKAFSQSLLLKRMIGCCSRRRCTGLPMYSVEIKENMETLRDMGIYSDTKYSQ